MIQQSNTGTLTDDNISVHQGVLRAKGRLYVGANQNWRVKMVQMIHDSSIGGHAGILGTYQRMKKLFYWPGLKKEVLEYIKRCDICQLNKGEHVASPGLLEPIPIPEGAWELITMDFIVGLPKSDGKEVILTVVDKLTKYAHFISLSHPFKAREVATEFLNTVYKLHGLPKGIITDRDPILTSNFGKELMEKLGIQLKLSTAYHPQTDGQSERVNQCIETYLRCMVFQQPKTGVRWISLAEFWYNTNFHTAIQTTPFEALYGYSPPHLPMGMPPKSANEAVNEVLRDRQITLQGLKEQLRRAQERMKKFADRRRTERKFKTGDWVYLRLQPYRQLSVHNSKKQQKMRP